MGWSEINMADELLFTKANKIATITLNRPEQLNTFHDAMLLPRLVGLTRALELLWSGDFISAEEAERIGLLSKVFDDEKLMNETYAFAERLANGPSIAIRLTKQAVYQCLRMDFLTALESITNPMGVAASTEDHREAVAAFKAKRPPQFKGY